MGRPTARDDYTVVSEVAVGGGFTDWLVRFESTVGEAFIRFADAEVFTPMFNGSDLSGWWQISGNLGMYQVMPASGEEPFYVEGTADGSLGMLAYSKVNYSDFELIYEFQIEDPLNSGVQIRSFVNSSNNIQGYQIEIDPSDRAWSTGIYEQLGRGWLNDLSENEAAREAFVVGGWNQVRVLAEGDRVRTWINGVASADYSETDSSVPRSGLIALQVHQGGSTILGKKVRIRNVYIRRL